MSFNLKNWQQITFTRRVPIAICYFIDTLMLRCVSSFTALGFLLDPKLNFNLQVHAGVNKALISPAFVY